MNKRNGKVFEKIYFALPAYFSPILSDSRKEGSGFKRFFAFDSTAIRLFSEVLKGAGRRLKVPGKQKSGLKVHMLTDIHAGRTTGGKRVKNKIPQAVQCSLFDG